MEKEKQLGLMFAVLGILCISVTAKSFGAEKGDPSQFLQQLDQLKAAVEPDAIVPRDFTNDKIFLPIASDQTGKLALGMNASGRRYRLDALWLDRGEAMKVLETRDGLSEAEYIRRYGNGALETRNIPNDILYQGRKEGIRLTEPSGFDDYLWETITDDGSTWMSLASGNSNVYALQKLTADKNRYRCTVRIGSHEFVTGEDYYVERLRLGTIQGIRIEEGG